MINDLPPEVFRMVMIETVEARDVKRAVRLRLVCKFWAEHVPNIVVESSLLVPSPKEYTCGPKRTPYDGQVIQRMLRRQPDLPGIGLQCIRLAAQYLWSEERIGNIPNVTDYLEDLCTLALDTALGGEVRISQLLFTSGQWPLFLLRDIMETQDLLAAATYVSSSSVVKRLLFKLETQHTHNKGEYFPAPWKTAIWRGDAQILSLIIENLKKRNGKQKNNKNRSSWSFDLHSLLGDMVDFTIEHDKPKMLKWCLGALTDSGDCASWTPRHGARSEAVMNMIIDHFRDLNQKHTTDINQPWLQNFVSDYAYCQARDGPASLFYQVLAAIPLSRQYTRKLHVVPLLRDCSARGNTEMIKYLLINKTSTGDAMIVAIQKGQLTSMKTLAKHGVLVFGGQRRAISLLECAIRLEHVSMLHFILEHLPMNQNLWAKAIEVAVKHNLWSMMDELLTDDVQPKSRTYHVNNQCKSKRQAEIDVSTSLKWQKS